MADKNVIINSFGHDNLVVKNLI